MELKDFLSSINHSKKPLLDNDEGAVKFYKPFIVNKCLSYFADTLFHANEMNCHPWLNPKTQFDFHRFSIRKKKRYSEWMRKETEENIAIIKEVYGYTESKAIEVLNILSPSDLEVIKASLYKGGTSKNA